MKAVRSLEKRDASSLGVSATLGVSAIWKWLALMVLLVLAAMAGVITTNPNMLIVSYFLFNLCFLSLRLYHQKYVRSVNNKSVPVNLYVQVNLITYIFFSYFMDFFFFFSSSSFFFFLFFFSPTVKSVKSVKPVKSVKSVKSVKKR